MICSWYFTNKSLISTWVQHETRDDGQNGGYPTVLPKEETFKEQERLHGNVSNELSAKRTERRQNNII